MVTEIHYLDFYNSLLEGNKENCKKIVDGLISEKTGIKELYLNLFQKSLYLLGKQWEQNKVTIAEEHMASDIIENLLIYSFGKYKVPKKKKGIALVSCIDKEYHEIGARMASHIFELNGWDSIFLGASTPTREIISAVRLKKPDIVGLSFNFYMNLMRFKEVLDHIKKYFPEQKVIVGGQGIKSALKQFKKDYNSIPYFDSIDSLDKYLQNGS